jgi:hypothetical protein
MLTLSGLAQNPAQLSLSLQLQLVDSKRPEKPGKKKMQEKKKSNLEIFKEEL